MDTETELAIQKSLEKTGKGQNRTFYCPSSFHIAKCHTSDCVDDGRLTESGTHEEIARQKGNLL